MTIDIRDYDLATLYRFKLFFDNTHWYNSPNLPITEIRNEHIYQGKRIEFPLLALRRVATPILYKDAQNSWANAITGDRRGRDISIAPDGRVSSADMTMVQTNYELKYMLDVFSFERDNFDELVIEVQENIFRYPYLTFENWRNKDFRIKDPQVAGMSTNIMWESTEDNTDLESFASQTPFYRATISFTVRAYIYRKYASLLLEEVINGYRILDYKKVVQQIVDSDLPPSPDPPVPPIPPSPDPPSVYLTTNNVPSVDQIGSMGMFLYSEEGEGLGIGSIVDGKYLNPVSISLPLNGFVTYSPLAESMSGSWKLLSYAKERTPLSPVMVFALKVSKDSLSSSDTSQSTMDSTQDNDSSSISNNDNNDSSLTGLSVTDLISL